MSRLDELIIELCPYGVPYLPISKIGTITRGKRFVHADAVEEGIPCIHYGEIYTYYGVWTDKARSHVRDELASKLRYAHKNDVIIVGAGENDVDIGIAVAYLGDERVAIHDACYIFHHNMDPKYISYCLRTEDYHKQIKRYVSSGKICAISAEGIGKAVIPVPPIEVQREIVHILDRFTELTAELIAKLTAELTARKKQYEYYTKLFFERLSDCEWRKLDDVLEWITYGFTSPMPDTEAGPWKITAKDIQDGRITLKAARHTSQEAFDRLTSKCKPKIDDILLTKDGTLGRTAIVSEEGICINQSVALLRPLKTAILPAYLHYLLRSPTYQEKMMEDIGGGTIKHIYITRVNQMEIPVPSKGKQRQIVQVFENSERVCTDLSSSLLTEIAARQKQYEYYRDKLLTFTEKGA